MQISPLLPGLRLSTLAKNVSQVVLYENQVSDLVALLWMQTPLGHWTMTLDIYVAIPLLLLTPSLASKKTILQICVFLP